MHATQIVRKAIGETSASYWQTLCETRSKNHPKRSGSYFRFDPARISSLLMGLEWEHGDFQGDLIVPPAKAYVARQVPGISNMMPLSEVRIDALLVLEDPKDTGIVECVWRTDKVEGHPGRFVTLIVGPTDGHDRTPPGGDGPRAGPASASRPPAALCCGTHATSTVASTKRSLSP